MAIAPNAGAQPVDTAKLAELAALVRQIQQQVRERQSGGLLPVHIAPVDLSALVAARDEAHRHIASIGQVNPREPGLANNVIQKLKRGIARGLGWFIRDQIAFNHEVIRSLNATIESLAETNRAIRETLEASHRESQELARRIQTEIAPLHQAAADFRATLERRQVQFELGFEDRLRADAAEQSASINKAIYTSAQGLQDLMWSELQKLWDAFAQTRLEYETLIHAELRTARQRAALPELPAAVPTQATAEPLSLDWLKFAEKFRGTEAHVRDGARLYVEAFRGHAPVVDIGCGRGEALELFRDAGIAARGIEASAELVALCRGKGLEAVCADAFAFLQSTEPGSLGGILCSQMLEHLSPVDIIRFIRLAHRALRTGGLLALETPNPECLAIFSTHFFLDPSHTRPIPPALMAFHLEEAGFGQLRIERLHPAIDSMPALADLPVAFRESFFGTLDYAAFGIKL